MSRKSSCLAELSMEFVYLPRNKGLYILLEHQMIKENKTDGTQIQQDKQNSKRKAVIPADDHKVTQNNIQSRHDNNSAGFIC